MEYFQHKKNIKCNKRRFVMVGSHYKLNVQLGVCMIKDLQ